LDSIRRGKTGWWTMTAKGEPLPTIREIPDDICEQIHPVIQRRDTAGLHRALACSTTRSASSRALLKAGASPRTDPLPVMISSVAWQPSDSLDRVRQRPPTKTCQPLGPTRYASGSPASGCRLPASTSCNWAVESRCPASCRGASSGNETGTGPAGPPEASPPGKVSELDFVHLVLIRDHETGRRRTAGRRSWYWAIPGTVSSGPPSVRRCRT